MTNKLHKPTSRLLRASQWHFTNKLAHEKTIAQLEGRTAKKVIVVPGKIINIVV